MEKMRNIVVPEAPIEADYGEWAFLHPECDTIMQIVGTGSTILVYGYAKRAEGNRELRAYRNAFFPNLKILKGVFI